MMDDDELIERLRHTLRTEAAAITPSPEGRPAAHHPPPVRMHSPRPRWPLALAAAAVAAAVSLAALNWPSGGSSGVGIVSPGPSTSVAPVVPTVAPVVVPTVAPVVVPPVASTVVSPPTSVPTPTTVPSAAAAVPAGFAPDAVTFVSPSDGWVAGNIPCQSGSCLALARTFDGGYTWRATPAPPVTRSNAGALVPVASVRFADRENGWVYALNPSRLWSTHDGGTTWHQVHLAAPAPGINIMAMEAAGGSVRVAVISVNSSTIHLESSPVNADNWTDTDTGIPIGAGPVPSIQLVLQKSQGWLLEDDRTVVGGARPDAAGRWTAWNPPCLTAGGSAGLAASTTTDLVAVCHEGEWGPADNLPVGTAVPSAWLFRSSDGGTSFQPIGPVLSSVAAQEIASPSPSTVVLDGSLSGSTGSVGGLSASFDGGHTWQTVYQAAGITQWSGLGFTTLTQGVVILSRGSGSALLMTRDGGHHWAPVAFDAGG